MKFVVRLLVGLAGLAAIFFGLRQMRQGIQEMTGVPMATPSMELGAPISLPEHGCSLRIPKDWERRPASQGRVMFVSPKSVDGAANIVVASEPFAGTLRAYAEANVTAVKAAMAAVEMADAEPQPFALESGAPALKVSFRNQYEGVEATQMMYFFDGPPGKKIVITANAPTARAEAYTPLFNGCLESLRVLPEAK